MAISRTMDSRMTLSGTVGTDPVLRAAGTGEVTNFRVVVNERVRDASGKWSNGSASWFDVAAWDELGQHVAASVRKGDAVVVHGEVSINEWTMRDGGTGRSVQIRASKVGHDLSFGTSTWQRAPRREAAVAPAVRPAVAPPAPDRSGEWSAPGTLSSTQSASASEPGTTSVALLEDPIDDDYDEPPF